MGTRAYEAEGIVVRFDLKRCIHAEECVHGLPMVFDAKRRPWIDPSQAGAAEVAAVVERFVHPHLMLTNPGIVGACNAITSLIGETNSIVEAWVGTVLSPSDKTL